MQVRDIAGVLRSVRVFGLCGRCRDQFAGRQPGTLLLVDDFVDEDKVVVATLMPLTQSSDLRGRMDGRRRMWQRQDGFLQLSCRACGARPRTHTDPIKRQAAAALSAGCSSFYVGS